MPLSHPVARVALGVAAVLSALLVATLTTDSVAWTASDFVLAGVLLAAVGTAIELAVSRRGGYRIAIGVAALGVLAAVFGEADDAPGLVLLGVLLVAGAFALALRRR